MKFIKVILVALVAVFVLSSCSKDLDVVLPKQNGTWLIDGDVTTIFENGEEVSKEYKDDNGKIKFTDNGEGTIEINGESPIKFKWNYDESKDEITIAEEEGSTTVFKVDYNKRKSQTWIAIVGDINSNGTRRALYLTRE